MGTSKDIKGPRGRPWTNYRRSATDFVRDRGDQPARRMFERFVEALGGAEGATEASRQWISSAQRTARLASAGGAAPLRDVFEDLGLGDLVGLSREDMLSGLADELAGDGSTLDEQAVRDALLFTLDEAFPETLSADQILDQTLSAEQVGQILGTFFARFVFVLLLRDLEPRIAKVESRTAQQAIVDEAWERTRALVRLRLDAVDVLDVPWATEIGAAQLREMAGEAFGLMEDLG